MGGKFSPQSAGVKYAPKARLPAGFFTAPLPGAFLRLAQKQLGNIDNLYIDGGGEML